MLKTVTIFWQAFWLSILYTGITLREEDIVKNMYINLIIYLIIDSANILLTGYII